MKVPGLDCPETRSPPRLEEPRPRLEEPRPRDEIIVAACEKGMRERCIFLLENVHKHTIIISVEREEVHVPFECELEVELDASESQVTDSSHEESIPEWQRFFNVRDIDVYNGTYGERRVYIVIIGGTSRDEIYGVDSLEDIPIQDRVLVTDAATDVKTEPDRMGFYDDSDRFLGKYEALRWQMCIDEDSMSLFALRLQYEKRPINRVALFVVVGGETSPEVVVPLMVDFLEDLDDKLLIDSASNSILRLWEEEEHSEEGEEESDGSAEDDEVDEN